MQSAESSARSDAHIDRGAWSWALFELARNPYALLCIIYVLAPYIAKDVIGDPVRGQATIALWQTIAGVLVALTAPFLGAAADRMGHRKPLLALVIVVMIPAVLIQYWALPNGAGLPIWALATAVIVAGVGYAWTEVIHNSMLSVAAKPRLISAVSGLGLSLGNAGGVLLLLFVLWAFALPGQLPIPGVPPKPLFGLDPEKFEPIRIVAPICAVWLVALSLPLFLWTPDRNATGEGVLTALRRGVVGMLETLRRLRTHGNVTTFLVARMFYVDGVTAIVIFAGVYVAGILGWQPIERLAFGVTLSIFASFGGLASAFLDARVGAKMAVAIEIAVTLAMLIVQVSISPTQILFIVPTDPSENVWGGPVFETASEVAYVLASIVIAISITASYASSRALMAQLTPPKMEGEVFGLYALAGSATAWLAPLLVRTFTSAFASQRVGFGSIGILLVAGFALLQFVKPPARS
mgnify:CR=1 FL=1